MRKPFYIPPEKRIYDTMTTSSAPHWAKDEFKKKADALGISPSRLLANLIFNSVYNDFSDEDFKIILPDISKEPYVEKAHISKAGTMLRMFEKFSKGATIEDLALLYREMGFKDLKEMMLAHRELVNVGMLVEERLKDPYTGKLRKVYVPDYLTKKMVEKKGRKLKALEKLEPEKGPLDDE